MFKGLKLNLIIQIKTGLYIPETNPWEILIYQYKIPALIKEILMVYY